MSRKPFNGFVALKKQAGVGPMLINEQRNIPCLEAMPANPINNGYLPVVDHTSYPSLRVRGRRTPAFSLSTCWKPVIEDDVFGNSGWTDADLFNSLLGLTGLDGQFNTDMFCGCFDDASGSTGAVLGQRIWDQSRCEMLTLTQTFMGGPITVQMTFLSRWGDSEGPYGTTLDDGEVVGSAPTFITPTGAVAAGEVTPVSEVSFNGTLDKVRAWQLSLMRGQGYQGYIDGSNYCKVVDSTMFSGSLVIQQDPDADLFIGVGGSNYGVCELLLDCHAPAGQATRFQLNVSLDTDTYPMTMQFGNDTRAYSLINLNTGGQPVVIQNV